MDRFILSKRPGYENPDRNEDQEKCATCCAAVFWTISLMVGVAIIALGAVYLHDCPVQPMIPIYLIVAASVGLVSRLLNLIDRCQGNRDAEMSPLRCLDGLMNLFLTAWFIAGCVWVYNTYSVVQYDPTKENFCNMYLFRISFWLLNLVFISIGCACVLACLAACLAACSSA